MITAYHRPESLEQALQLLNRPSPRTLPLGGGTLLSHPSPESFEVVDLQSLGLNYIRTRGKDLELGATVSLQQFLESEYCPESIEPALKLEAPLNLRNAATIAGTLITCDGRSTLTTALLAFDARLNLIHLPSSAVCNPSSEFNRQSSVVSLGDFLPLRPFGLISQITIPTRIKFTFQSVSRTPADKPIVCAALAQWPSGRTRLALGGCGKSPLLAMDGTASDDLEAAARNCFHDASDEWASAEYRLDIASILAKRCQVLIRANK